LFDRVARVKLVMHVQVRHEKWTFSSVTSISKTSVSRDALCRNFAGQSDETRTLEKQVTYGKVSS